MKISSSTGKQEPADFLLFPLQGNAAARKGAGQRCI